MHDRKSKSVSLPGSHPSPIKPGEGRVEGQLPGFITAQTDGVSLAIKLQPRASMNKVGEPQGPELRVSVTAPPVDAAANEALLRLLADTLDCPRGAVELVRGQTARHKIVRIHGATPVAILAKLGG
jgi:uncharacterized protein (TIGR00251 family)